MYIRYPIMVLLLLGKTLNGAHVACVGNYIGTGHHLIIS
jgi:hypothetical protein